MKDIRNHVEEVLKNYPAARNDDKLLIVLVYQVFYGVVSITDILRKGVPSTEAITRTRRRIQEEGMYLATDDSQEGREREREEYRKFYENKDKPIASQSK